MASFPASPLQPLPEFINGWLQQHLMMAMEDDQGVKGRHQDSFREVLVSLVSPLFSHKRKRDPLREGQIDYDLRQTHPYPSISPYARCSFSRSPQQPQRFHPWPET